MLANVLALVVGLGSLAIYIAAFFFPEIHRKNDFIWSGVGLFLCPSFVDFRAKNFWRSLTGSCG